MRPPACPAPLQEARGDDGDMLSFSDLLEEVSITIMAMSQAHFRELAKLQRGSQGCEELDIADIDIAEAPAVGAHGLLPSITEQYMSDGTHDESVWMERQGTEKTNRTRPSENTCATSEKRGIFAADRKVKSSHSSQLSYFHDIVKTAVFKHYREQVRGVRGDPADIEHSGSLAVQSLRRVSEKVGALALAKGWQKQDTRDRSGSFYSQQVKSRRFDCVCASLIVLNAVVLAISTDETARLDNPDDLPFIYVLLDRLFTAVFLIELIMRVSAEGCCLFYTSRHWRWNLFDSIVVISDLTQTIFQIGLDTSDPTLHNLTAIRMVRILRIARAIRVVRLLRFFKDLRLMVMTILKSGASLIWCVVMLCSIMYVFAIYLMHNVVYYLYENREKYQTEEIDALRENFGSLAESFYTLFQAISGGVSWREVANPLIEVHWTNGLVFCFYVFFTLFAVMNIITGIFVETSISSAQNDFEEVLAEQLHNENSTLHQLQKLFLENVDVEQLGYVTKQQFEACLQDRRVRDKLRVFGIDVQEAYGIFALLDLDSSGSISVEEFVYGCMRLKGAARSLDVTTLLYEHKRLVEKFMTFFGYVKGEFQKHEKFEGRLEEMLGQQVFPRALYPSMGSPKVSSSLSAPVR